MSKQMSSGLLASVVVLGLSTVASPLAAAPIVYAQPVTFSSAWLSEDVSGGATVWRTFDNFALAASGTVVGVNFTGAYVDLSNAVFPAPDSTAFTFRFFADAAGAPAGAALHEETVAFGAVSQSYLGTALFGGFKSSVYSLSADLPVGFAATGNTPYWLAISSVAPAGNVQWAWVGGAGGNNSTLQVLAGNTEFWRTGDRAFSLEAVPEPGSIMLVTAGLVGLFVRRRAGRARPTSA